MSENIQSISQGTFTIGQTSATNFIAGPGISIDSPSAGTVRIGNDETVLWSGTMASAANLSEPMTAFDYVKVYYADDFTDTGRYHTVAQLDPNNGAHMWQPIGGLGEANCWVGVTYISANDDYTTICVPKVKLFNYGSWTSTATSMTKVTTGANVSVLYKVVGVNHLSGSNA